MNLCIHSLGSIKISMYSSVALIHVFLGSKIVFKVISSIKVELLRIFILKHAIIVAVSLLTF